METMSKATGPLEAAAYDFSRCTTIADIAGGTGVLLGHILTRTPGARGILFDQAHVVAEAPPVLAAAGVAHRVTIESGSFFERVPAGADAYVMKRILHDWPDKESIDILRCCRKAMTPQARLVLVESIVGPPNEDQFSKFLDLTMLVSAGGRERTQAEWAALLYGRRIPARERDASQSQQLRNRRGAGLTAAPPRRIVRIEDVDPDAAQRAPAPTQRGAASAVANTERSTG